ncbi:serine hydrolase [Pseudonocardia acidicola]|uniref:Serine hydrolase n=1 Tax=Pseudonocardia acidicola TaxID=2724939 RepID=A0ABX1S360_9PSEU|nr:serine hydrolase [Pseudonocardia acidicola]NMH96021.1 serine hydrolase [Pseudonocardia acidicola]
MKRRRRPSQTVFWTITLSTALAVASVGTTVGIVHRSSVVAQAPVRSTAADVPAPGPAAPALKSAAAVAPARPEVSDAVRAVTAADADAAKDDDTQFGIAVLDRDTGDLAAGENGDVAFYSASVVKLFTVVAILHRTETDGLTLTAADRTDIERALSLSDDNAMDALWEQFGGPETVQQTIDLVGLQDTRPPSDPSQWGETLISARDVVAVYRYVLTSMPAADRDTIMNALGAAQDSGADGFDQAFGLLREPRLPDVAAKQGWMWFGSDFYLHTTGVVGSDDRYVVALLSKQPASEGSAAASTSVTAATNDVLAALG